MKFSGCLGFLIVIGLILLISCLMGLLITYATIWIAQGLFNYDLSDKFWYIFVLYYILVTVLKTRITVNK